MAQRTPGFDIDAPAPRTYPSTVVALAEAEVSKRAAWTDTVNGKTYDTADLDDWDDCPKCVYGQVMRHTSEPGDWFECMDECGFATNI